MTDEFIQQKLGADFRCKKHGGNGKKKARNDMEKMMALYWGSAPLEPLSLPKPSYNPDDEVN